MRRNTQIMILLALAVTPLTAFARQALVRNGSFEGGTGAGGIDERVPLGWTRFGAATCERSGEAALTGSQSFKAFGGETTVGAYQDVPVVPGQAVSISARLYTRAGDRIGGDATANIKLEFYDGADPPALVGSPSELVVLTGASPADVWTPAAIGPVVAPAGAVSARMVCVFTYTTVSSGAAYWDNTTLTIGGGPNLLQNASFEEAGTSEETPFGITSWLGFGTQQKSQDVSEDGESSARISVGGAGGSGFSGLYQDTQDADANQRVVALAKVWNPSDTGLSLDAAAAIKLEFQPAGGTTIPPAEEALDFDQLSPPDQWVPVSYSTTVPAGITLARVVILQNDVLDTTGPVYVDSASAVRSSTPGNSLLNASFEDGPGGPNGLQFWSEFRGLGCSARKHEAGGFGGDLEFEGGALAGDFVCKITGRCIAGIFQDIPVTPGETLTIAAFFRARSVTPFANPASTAGVKVEWRGGATPPQVDIGAPGQNNTIFAGAATDTWLPLSIDYTMPPGSAARLRFTVIAARGSSSEARVYFDSFEGVITNRFDGADTDGDNDEDLLDFAELQRCYAGAGGGRAWGCFVFDQDEDGDVDAADTGFFLPRLNGPRP